MKYMSPKFNQLIPFMAMLVFGLPGPDGQVVVKEFVHVVNVEVIVRVSDQGKPVSGLTKSDFRLTEDGQALAADLAQFTRRVEMLRRKTLSDMQFGASQDVRNSIAPPTHTGPGSPLDIDVEQFKKFAASLKNIEMEKWILVFCQRNLALRSSAAFLSSEINAPTRFVQKYTVETDLLSRVGYFSAFISKQASAGDRRARLADHPYRFRGGRITDFGSRTGPAREKAGGRVEAAISG
jgi:hypothetical protein